MNYTFLLSCSCVAFFFFDNKKKDFAVPAIPSDGERTLADFFFSSCPSKRFAGRWLRLKYRSFPSVGYPKITSFANNKQKREKDKSWVEEEDIKQSSLHRNQRTFRAIDEKSCAGRFSCVSSSSPSFSVRRTIQSSFLLLVQSTLISHRRRAGGEWRS